MSESWTEIDTGRTSASKYSFERYNFDGNEKIIVVDEQTQYGNLSSAVQSELSKYDLFPKLKNVSLPDEYVFENGGRDFLHKKYNLDEISILNFSKKIQKNFL